jgi:hypothetical protein
MVADLIVSMGWFAIGLALAWRLRSRRRGFRVVAILDGRSPAAGAEIENSSFRLGCEDARAFRAMRTGMPPDYYDGYSFICGVDGLA